MGCEKRQEFVVTSKIGGDRMIDSNLEQYLSKAIDKKDNLITQLEQYAEEHNVPIMEPLGIDFLQQMIRMNKPKRILEIGTAIGYSAICMAQSHPDTYIVTMERDEQRYQEAVKNIEAANLTDRIEVIFGDALEEGVKLQDEEPFDLLFIDAAKGQYKRFFELFEKTLSPDGVIISDNVLFKGYVYNNPEDGTNKAKIAKKIETYNQWLLQHPDYKTSIVPIGDGVAVSVKR